MLDESSIEGFVRDGYSVLRRAVPPAVTAACQRDLAADLRARGVDIGDAATWTTPVMRMPCPESPAFASAGSQPELWSVYDQLLGPGRWSRRRTLQGTIPVRFPHPEDPGDGGWHIDGGFALDGEHHRVNVRSRNRGLLVLFLLVDVGGDDAPTELRVGSHLDVPAVLTSFGDSGTSFATVSRALTHNPLERASVQATGEAGDVYICHPFLMHRSTWPHCGHRPRAIATAGITLLAPLALDGVNPYPVERAILDALDRR